MRISDWSSDVCSSDLAGISGRGPKPAGEGRREPARELTRAQRHRVQLREIDKPPGEAMMQDDPIAVYRIAGGGHGLVHGRGPCDERAAAGQWTDPSCAKMASGLISWCSLATSDQAAAGSA